MDLSSDDYPQTGFATLRFERTEPHLISASHEPFFTFGRVPTLLSDHPLSPGLDSAIEKGPWHYGADYITVYFRAPKDKLRGLVPSPFAVDDGTCMAYVCEIVSVGDGASAMVHTRPDRTLYNEAAVGIRVEFGGKKGVFFPVMWVTTEWSLLRGLLNGYQKRLADRISMTKLHQLNPGLEPVGAGSEFGGFCVKGPETTLAVTATVRSRAEPSALPSFGVTYGLRNYPSTGPNQSGVREPVEVLKSNSRVSDVWVGAGTVRTTLDVGEVEPTSAAVYKSGFTISGSKALLPK